MRITGNMSITILKGLPYAIQQAALFVQDYEVQQIKEYIESILLQGSKIVDITVEVDWDFGDDEQHNAGELSSVDDVSDHDSDDNVIVDPVFGNLLDNISLPNLSDDTHDSDWSNLFHDSDVQSDENQHSDEEKHDFIGDYNIVSDDERNNELPDVSNIDNSIRNASGVSNVSNKITNNINFLYKYKIEGINSNYYFDNNDNEANVLYSRSLNLAVMFDYCSLMRKVFSVFCTLKFPKDENNITPQIIKKAQIWGRSALYKSHLLADYLTNDYAFLTGGVGTYMLEAFYHYNPNGYGFYIVCQQMCEHWGAWMKSDRRACGDPRGSNYLFQIANNSDLNVLARVFYDQVDFDRVVKTEKLETVSMWDIETIEREENACIQTGPKVWKLFTIIIGRIHVNGLIPRILYDVSRLDKSEYTRLTSAMQEQIENLIIDNEIEHQHEQSNIDANWQARVENTNKYIARLDKKQMRRQARK